MTIISVVITVVSVFAFLRILGPFQAMTICVYAVVGLKLNGSASILCIKRLLLKRIYPGLTSPLQNQYHVH